MDIDTLNVYLLSSHSSAPLAIRKKLESFGVESFGLYHSYRDLCEIVSASKEACLVIDLLENENLKFNFDLEYFVSQAAPYGIAQALVWLENNGEKPFVEIDSNFRIIGEELWSVEEAQDGLVRVPIYYFSEGKACSYIKETAIESKGEEWFGLPIGSPSKELDYSDKKPALFLDRDGIINEDKGYVYLYEELKYNEGIFPIIRMFNDRFWPVFILTNQSGVGQGKYKEDDVLKLHARMDKDFKEKDLKITEWVYSPYHFEKGIGTYKRLSFTRKPGSGMALKLLESHAIDLEKSFMIGDKLTDQLLLAGITTLLLKGRYPLEGSKSVVFESLKEIENFLKDQI